MSCDIGRFLPVGDSPVAEVEYIVHLHKYTTEATLSFLQGFRPPRNMDIPVRTEENHLLSITGYMNTLGHVYLDLQHGTDFLRKLHTHPDHHNPDGMPVDSPHKHFPSTRYPLGKSRHGWAYYVDDVGPEFSDITEAVEAFCAELDVSIETWQPYLNRDNS